jgi:hypothetical protein
MRPNILDNALMSELCWFVDAHPEQTAELLAVVGCQFGMLLAAAQPEIAANTRERLRVALDRLDARGGALVMQWMRLGEVVGQELVPVALDHSPDQPGRASGEAPGIRHTSGLDQSLLVDG